MNAQDILRYGHLTLMGSIDGLTDEEWAISGVCGWWSCKDIVGHYAAFELALVDVLSGFAGTLTDAATITRMGTMGGDGFNNYEAEQRKDRTWREILDEYLAAYERSTALAAQISPEKWREVGTIPWYGQEYSLDDYIVYTFYGHKREHTGQIGIWRGARQSQNAG